LLEKKIQIPFLGIEVNLDGSYFTLTGLSVRVGATKVWLGIQII